MALDSTENANAEPRSPILCLGVARTGTASLGEALRILGYSRVHHGQEVVQNDPDLEVLDRAADATFPTLPTYRGTPFTREEWDAVMHKWDVVTDMFAYYATSLIAAYPEARVILVERDIDSWFRSWKDQKQVWFSPVMYHFVQIVSRIAGLMNGPVAAKFILGWIGSNHRRDIFTEKAKEAYIRHYREVRASVRPDLLLDFKLADGWEPLCRFVGKDVPDQEFPRLNDLAAYKAKSKGQSVRPVIRAMKRIVGMSVGDEDPIRPESTSQGT